MKFLWSCLLLAILGLVLGMFTKDLALIQSGLYAVAGLSIVVLIKNHQLNKKGASHGNR